MNANLFPRKFVSSPWTEAHKNIIDSFPSSGPNIDALFPAPSHEKAAKSFTNASAPIFERDFPKYGVAPIERPDIEAIKANNAEVLAKAEAFYPRHPNSQGRRISPVQSDFWANTPWPSEIPSASDEQIVALVEGRPVDLSPAVPKELKNERIYALGGVPRAFLRVRYHVQPKIEWRDNTKHIENIWGQVLPGEVGYLIESPHGSFYTIAEWTTVADLPVSLRRIEESNRPNHEALGWSEADLLEVSGEHPDANEP